MNVKSIMSDCVECVRPDDSIATAASKMRALNVGSLPVCSDSDQLVGMVTDRDITVRATAQGGTPAETRVNDVMTPEVIYCFDNQGVEEASQLMKEKQIRRLVVLNRSKRLVGILSLGDMALGARDQESTGETLEAISQPDHSAAGAPLG